MPVDSVHENYQLREADWQMIRDSLEGERVIKARRHVYLPVPPGMATSSNEVLENGKRVTNDRYSFYLSFAEFPELIAPTLNGFQGIIHSNEPHVELPRRMEYLLEDATPEGEPLNVLWERVTRELLVTGRIGLLADSSMDDNLRLATYSAENILNWRLGERREGGDPMMLVLREFQELPKEDDEFELEDQVVYRELRLMDGKYWVRVWAAKGARMPRLSLAGRVEPPSGGSSSDEPEVIQDWYMPTLFGRPFQRIPFVCMNVHEIGFSFGPVPLLPLVRRALSIYRKSADYNRALYIKGDPQVVISGITQEQAPSKIGGDSVWCLPNPQARAMYLDIDGQGIPLMKDAINDEYERFYQEGGKLLDTAERPAESGEALRRRQVALQVSLRTIAQNAGEAMQHTLRQVAELLGEDPSTVKFQADLDFAEPNMAGRELLDIMAAKAQGAPYSNRSIHERMRRGGLTRLTYEQEQEELRTESRGVDGLPEAEPGEAERSLQGEGEGNNE